MRLLSKLGSTPGNNCTGDKDEIDEDETFGRKKVIMMHIQHSLFCAQGRHSSIVVEMEDPTARSAESTCVSKCS